MKFGQLAKRISLFLMVNLLITLTISLILGFFRVYRFFPTGGLAGLAVICLVWGFAGAFISLALSRMMAKWMMGVQVIPPDTSDPALRNLVETVHGLARGAGLPEMPEVGIYDSPDINAFATGPSRSRALVAVSTGLLQRMGRREVEGVLGHEIAHVANGDMVTMTLVQGVVNAFALFLSQVVAFIISQAMRSRDDDRERDGGGFMQWILSQVFYMVFSVLGAVVVCWFSRLREFRADAGGARLAGRQNMIDALRALKSLHDPEAAAIGARESQAFQAMKISHPGGILALFSTHPPLEERIARLEQGAME
jgi:heat shock protein HtpX